MQSKITSEHTRIIRFKTIIPIIVISILFATCLLGVGAVFYMYAIGHKVKSSDAIFIICAGCLFAFLLGFMLARFIRRMLSVRKIILFEDDKIGVLTLRNNLYTAKLPDNIKHMLTIGTDFTVTLQIKSRYFVVDSEQFSDKDSINEFWRRFVDRYKAKNG